jgi:hypothetical protein
MRYGKIELTNGEEWFTALADWTLSTVDVWDDLTGDPISFAIVARIPEQGHYITFSTADGYYARLPRLTQKLPNGYLALVADIATGDFAIRDAPELAGGEWFVHHCSTDESYRADDDYILHLLNPKLGDDFISAAWRVTVDGYDYILNDDE